MGALAGTGRLIRLALRRDRFILPLWIIAIAGFLALTTSMSARGLPDQATIETETRFMAGNPGMRMLSLSAGANVGAYAMSRTFLTIAILAAVMSTLAVVRHTRQSEERGRDELLRAGVIGPSAGLVAAVTVTLGANLVLAPLLALAMIGQGQPVEGALMAGAATASVGVAFTGIAAMTSQLSSTARGANGLAMAVLAVAFAASGVGNMLGGVDGSGMVAVSAWPTWLSPIGWGFEMRPFGANRWWVLALPVVFAVALIVGAAWYASKRDLGRGVLPVQTGRSEAPRTLLRPFGLAWRLQRSAFIAWLIGLLGFGLIFGSVTESLTSSEGSIQEWYQELGATSDTLKAFFTSMVELAAMGAAIYAVQVLLRMREEEVRGRLEPVLAGAVTRPRWVAGYVLTTVIGVVALLLAFSVGMALTAGLVLGDVSGLLGDVITAALAQLPAVLVVAGAVVVIFAVVPQWAVPVSWLVLAVAIVFSPVWGTSIGLPESLLDISPFTHQMAPASAVSAGAFGILLAIAVALGVLGIAAFRRRDLVPG